MRLRRVMAGRTVWLASASPRRRAILRACGIRHGTIEHSLHEPAPHGPDWRAWVRTWARRKAAHAARAIAGGWVIGSDTIVVSGGKGLGKPKDKAEAQAMLRRLSGRTHRVYSGVAIVDAGTGKSGAGSSCTQVCFRPLADHEIAHYVRTGEPLDKAGAYAIQGGARAFVTSIDGPLDGVIGLPIGTLVQIAGRLSW
ncbi:MAG: Maf family protein [Candidatus Zixiibacteriota bacterium]